MPHARFPLSSFCTSTPFEALHSSVALVLSGRRPHTSKARWFSNLDTLLTSTVQTSSNHRSFREALSSRAVGEVQHAQHLGLPHWRCLRCPRIQQQLGRFAGLLAVQVHRDVWTATRALYWTYQTYHRKRPRCLSPTSVLDGSSRRNMAALTDMRARQQHHEDVFYIQH